jgi:hypothetical protein
MNGGCDSNSVGNAIQDFSDYDNEKLLGSDKSSIQNKTERVSNSDINNIVKIPMTRSSTRRKVPKSLSNDFLW